jgi:hypothetical protein
MPIIYKKSVPARVPVVYQKPKGSKGLFNSIRCTNNHYKIATMGITVNSNEAFTYKLVKYCKEPVSFTKINNAQLYTCFDTSNGTDARYGKVLQTEGYDTVYVPSDIKRNQSLLVASMACRGW